MNAASAEASGPPKKSAVLRRVFFVYRQLNVLAQPSQPRMFQPLLSSFWRDCWHCAICRRPSRHHRESGQPCLASRCPPAARSRRRERLRRACVQHQQHGTGAGHHGGLRSGRCAGDHPGLARRPLLRQRHHAEAHDGCGDRDLSAHPGLRASRPRQRARDLHDRDPGRLHLGDDGWLTEGRRQRPPATGITMSA